MDPAFAVLGSRLVERRARCEQEVRVCGPLIDAGDGPVTSERLYQLVHTFPAADPSKSRVTRPTALAASAALRKQGREVPPELISSVVHVRGVLEEGRVGKATRFASDAVGRLKVCGGHLRLADLVTELVPKFPLVAPRHLLALVAQNRLIGRGELQLTVERTPAGRPLVRLSLRTTRPVGGGPPDTAAAIDGGVGAPVPTTSLWATLSGVVSSVGSSVGLW